MEASELIVKAGRDSPQFRSKVSKRLQWIYTTDRIQCGYNGKGQRIAQEGMEEASVPWSMLSLDHLLHYSFIPGISWKHEGSLGLPQPSATSRMV